MADPRPWSNDEKNTLMAEIIKQQSPHPAVLYGVAKNLNAQPRWEDLPLPPGRSLNSCRAAFDDLGRSQPPILMPSMYGPQTPLSAPPPGIKRPFQLEAPFPVGREIRPKPYPAAGGAGQQSAAEPPLKRKRGRPTKAAAQAKAAAEAATRPEPGPAPPAQPSPQITMTPITAPAPLPEEPRAALPALPPTTRMPISAVLTPTAPKTASSSSSSSGKRRRGRSTRSEPEGLGEASGLGGYASPYGQTAVVEEDTPARTAVLRHREEQAPPPPPFQQDPRSDPSEPGAGSGPSGPA